MITEKQIYAEIERRAKEYIKKYNLYISLTSSQRNHAEGVMLYQELISMRSEINTLFWTVESDRRITKEGSIK